MFLYVTTVAEEKDITHNLRLPAVYPPQIASCIPLPQELRSLLFCLSPMAPIQYTHPISLNSFFCQQVNIKQECTEEMIQWLRACCSSRGPKECTQHPSQWLTIASNSSFRVPFGHLHRCIHTNYRYVCMCAYMFKTHQEARFWDLQCLCALLFSSFPWAFRVIVNLSFLHRKWALGNGGLWYAQLLGGRERIWKSVSWCRKDSHPMPFPPNWSDNSELTLLREASGRREQMRRCDVGCSDQHRAKSKMTAQPISFPVASKKWQHQRAQTEDSGHIVPLDWGWIRFLSTCFFSLLNSTAWHCAGPCASCSWWGKWGGRVCWEQAEQLASLVAFLLEFSFGYAVVKSWVLWDSALRLLSQNILSIALWTLMDELWKSEASGRPGNCPSFLFKQIRKIKPVVIISISGQPNRTWNNLGGGPLGIPTGHYLDSINWYGSLVLIMALTILWMVVLGLY